MSASVTVSNVECMSPELVLVCPELRETAIEMLPERDPDAWLDQHRSFGRIRLPEYRLMQSLDPTEAQAELERSVALPVAVLAYTIQSAVKFTAEAAVFMALATATVSILAVVRP